ncbi:MAG: Ig-like domain-containing protein [Pseudomonadota bacterium]
MLNWMRKALFKIFFIAPIAMLTACGGGGGSLTGSTGGGETTDVSAVTVALSAASTSLNSGQTTTLTATVSGTSAAGLEVSFLIGTNLSGASLSADTAHTDTSGKASVSYTAGTLSGSDTVIASVTDANGNTVQSSVSITVTGKSVASLQLLLSNTQLRSDGSDSINVTAIAKDANNTLISGVPVTFTASSGNLVVVSSSTSASGVASAELDSKGDPANRTITVSATSGSLTASADVTVSGTVITISAPPSATIGQTVSIPLSIKAIDTPLSGRSLNVTATGGTVVSQPAATNSGGETNVSVVATSNPVQVSVSDPALNASNSASISVSTDIITLTASSADPVAIGSARGLNANLKCGGVATPGVAVSFTSTRGTLSAASVITDGTGNATNSISSNTSGPALISAAATCPGGQAVQSSIELSFVATVPARVDVQADPTVVSANQAGSTTNQSRITAIVRDANNNLVYNSVVAFTLTDSTGGSLTATTATTDLYGRATVNYIAGTSASAKDGVIIDATVQETAITDQATITVAGLGLFITLGTGNTIAEPNSTTYAQPWSVLVTGPAGDPIPNATVTIAIIPEQYRKGFYEWTSPVWSQVVTATCANEDVDRDGVLDTSVDIDLNNNGRLEPGNVAAPSTKTLTTDSTGFAYFDINYAQQYANWVNVTLQATATVSGSESVETARFWLEGLASDFNKQDVDPPGNPSPFGQSLTCTDTL